MGASLDEHSRAVVDVQVRALPREFADEDVLVAVLVEVARVHAHARLEPPFGADRRAGEERGIHEPPVALIDPQLIRSAVVGDVDVDPSIAVEVGGGDAQRGTELGGHARGDRHVAERAVPIVAKQMARPGAIRAGRAVVALTGDAVADDVPGDRVVEILTHEQVQPAVAIDVHERRRHAPTRIGRAARGGDVGERAVAVVSQQLIRPELGDVKIDAAVVVDSRRWRHPSRSRARRCGWPRSHP